MGTLSYVTPSTAQVDRMNKFRTDMERIIEDAHNTAKQGRNLSLFTTKMEEASMWLNKAITQDGLKEPDDGA